MTRDLQDLLHRVGEAVEPVSVPKDTWRRGRRARTRDRVVWPAAGALLVLGLVAGVLQPGWLPHAVVLPAGTSASGDGAVPEHIYDVPESVDAQRGDGSRVTPLEPVANLAGTRASAAFVTRSGVVVLVTAADGVHHRVALPGFSATMSWISGEVPVAVAPDGRSLAYAWRELPRPAGNRWPSGIAVLDLDRPASPRVQRIDAGAGVRVSNLVWSPGGGYLAYQVGVAREMTEQSFASKGYYVERLDVATGERTRVPGTGSAAPAAVADDGRVAYTRGDLRVWSPDAAGAQRIPLDRTLLDIGAWAPDGGRIALGAFDAYDVLATVDLTDQSVRDGGRSEVPSDGAVLGWAGADSVVMLRHPSESWDHQSLLLVDARTGATRQVGTVDNQAALTLSLAAGLMSAQQPTVDFAAPSWAGGTPWGWWAAGAVLLVAAAAWWGRSRRASRFL